MNTENESPSFVHLHLNTNYSFYHGLVGAEVAAKFCQEAGMTACACTDHGTLGGSMRFKRAMADQGVKPIYGCEFLVGDWEEDLQCRHVPQPHRGMTLVCLAENLEGYRNLCQLASNVVRKDFGRVSSVSMDLLGKYHNGLIALSGGPSGEVSRKCLTNNPQAVDHVIAQYLEIFGRGNFFLELQDHGLPEEQIINRELLAAAKRNDVPLVATNDVHYLTKEEARAHEILLCIADRSQVNAEEHSKLPGGPEYYMKTAEEMERLFHWCPEALRNTLAIADRCNVVIPTKDKDSTLCHKPLFQLPADFNGTQDDYLRSICKAGLRRRYGIDADAPSHTTDEQRILDRMERELNFITSASLASELLVIWDLLWDVDRDDWKWYHIGRGAVCGSLVAYLLPIIDIDPLKYSLLFERFLNEERTPALNIDIAGGVSGEDIVLQEACKRYGHDKVATRVEVLPLLSRTIAARVAQALSYEDHGRLVALVAEYNRTAKNALENSQELQNLIRNNALAKECVEATIALEGKILGKSLEYTGLVISDINLPEVCAVNQKSGNSGFFCHLDFNDVQQLGMMEIGRWRMDSFVEETLKRYGGTLLELPDNAPEAFATLARDDNGFYIESMPDELSNDKEQAKSLRKQFVREYGGLGRHLFPMVKPNSIEELIAFYAIYHPGPMVYLDEFLSRRSGKVPVVYETPELEPILKETYGLVLYQEQFMQVVQAIAGLSLEQADCLRRATGLRKTQKQTMLKEEFFEAARKRGFSDENLRNIWDKLHNGAMYSYMKSHAAARALLLYRVAYLRSGMFQKEDSAKNNPQP